MLALTPRTLSSGHRRSHAAPVDVGEGSAEINGVDNDEVVDEESIVGVAGADELDIDAPDREAKWALTWSWSAR